MGNALDVQVLIDGVYTSKKAFIEEAVTAQCGPDPDSGTEPSTMQFTFDNDDLSLDPSNALSALYGKIGRYTPMRVRLGGNAVQYGEAKSWEPDRSINHTPGSKGRATCTVVANGVLDRLNLWKTPLQSPMFQLISTYSTSLGYWPMEGPGTNLPNVLPNGFTGKVTGSATWAGDPDIGGSDDVIKLGSDGALSGSFIRATGNNFLVSIVIDMSTALTATENTIFRFRTSAGLLFDWRVSSGSWRMQVTRETDGTLLMNTTSGFGTGINPLSPIRFQFKVTVSGSTVTVAPSWYAQDASTVWGISDTFSGTTTGVLTNWEVVPSTYTNGAGYGHLVGLTSTADILSAGLGEFNGFLGETAGGRWGRLLSQAGIAWFASGDFTKTVPMGRQKPGLLPDLLQECVDTDGALQYDDPLAIGITFRTRGSRYGQTSKLDLTYGVNVATPLKKLINPTGVANQITVTNATGASATATRTTGSMSTQNPPAGIGVVKGSVDVNQQDDGALDDRAAWELNASTLDRPLYQQLTVDLLAFPALAAACLALRPGDLITLAGIEPDPILLHVMQFERAWGHTTFTFTMKCVPGDLWTTGAYGVSGRWSVAMSTNGTMTTTSTSLSILLANPTQEQMSTTNTGYDLVLNNGERVTVTGAFSAPVAGVQTATVTRSVNGVVRAHVAGEPVQLYRPMHYAY